MKKPNPRRVLSPEELERLRSGISGKSPDEALEETYRDYLETPRHRKTREKARSKATQAKSEKTKLWTGKEKRAQRVARRLARKRARETANLLLPLSPDLTPEQFYSERNRTLREMGFPSYAAYLASPLWSHIRARVFALDEGRCRLCLAEATEIHHTSYDRHTMKGRTLRHLHALCRACHEKVEFEEGETERKRRTPHAMGQAVQAGIQNDRGALVRKLIETRRQGEDLDSDFLSRLSSEP